MGKYASLILPALSRRHEVDIWCPLAPRILESQVPVITFDASRALGDPRLDEYQMLVYQMGNDANHFLQILELASHRPGILILHDYVLHGLLANYYLSVLRQPLDYVLLMERTYGEQGRKLAEDTVIGRNPGVWTTGAVSDYPLFEPLLANALGAVVHSDFYLSAVRRAFSGPSTKVNLALHPLPSPSVLTRTDLGVPEDRVLILSIGYIGKSKLLDVTIRALYNSPELASRVVFAIVGRECPEESPRLHAMVRDFGLENSVRFVGFQPEHVMHAWIERADFCVNLRRPNTEGASLSVLEQMQHGKAAVVLPNGYYAELPPDAVAIADPYHLESYQELLLRLANDRVWRACVGAKAREYVSKGFDPENYGARLADLIAEVHARTPLTLLAHRVSRELSHVGETAKEIVGPYADAEIRNLFATEEQTPSDA
jgi:glycosyltransferase involved in cell wall biosynthesis